MTPRSITLHAKRTLALAITIFVNLLFVYKYTERVLPFPGLLVLLMAVFYTLIWHYKDKPRISSKLFHTFLWGSFFAFLLISMFLFRKIPMESLNVDRWSVITSFWDNYFDSKYVYFAKSHMGNPPGPMPFYFIIALPFYLIGELGYLPLLGLLIFLVLLLKTKASLGIKLWALVFVLTSFFFLWEVVTRSPLFLNSTLIVILAIWYNSLDKRRWGFYLAVNAILAGFLLSTRNVYIIPYIILFLYSLLYKQISFKNLFLYSILSVSTFAITFIPFVLNYLDDFFVMNPFIVQSSFLIPFHFTIAFFTIAIVGAFFCKQKLDTFFFSGITLFTSIVIYFIYHIFRVGFHAAYLESVVDISYFIFCIPFLLYYLIKSEQDQPKHQTKCVLQ